MKRQNVIELLRNPLLLSNYSYDNLNDLSSKYPHFTALKFLVAQKAKQTYADKFDEMLPQLAAAVPDRTMLYKRLLNEFPEIYYEQTTEDYWQDNPPLATDPEASKEVKQDLEALSTQKEVIPDSLVDPVPTEEIKLEVLQDLNKIKDTPPKERALNENRLITNIKSRIANFKKNKEAGKFGDASKPVDRMSNDELKKLINADKDNVQEIEKYLRETYGDQLDHSPSLRSSIADKLNRSNVTETLAKIYEQQGDTGKAVHVYEQLSQQFPDKKAYFIDRIKMLRNIE